ncbi:MAG: flagellar hook-length control protein FliK [Oleiphilaceae bacterium]|nr:flagellar hook-length control protein FliK [Oleiphilaceae bacterium]
MQSANVLLEINAPSRARPPQRPADKGSEPDGSFRDHETRAREKAANSDRPDSVKEPALKTADPAAAGPGLTADLKAMAENLDLPALAEATGLSEGQIEGLLSGDISIEGLLSGETTLDGVLQEAVLPEDLLQGLNALVEQLQEQAPELATALMGTGLTENVLARLSSGAEPALATQLANLASIGPGKNGNGSGKVELAQLMQATMAAEGEGAGPEEPLLRRVLGASSAADTGESLSQSKGNGESLQLVQGANGLRLGDPREPAGSLKHYTTSVETSLDNQEEWNQKMAGKLSWLTTQGLQSAEILLNPPDMGPVEVRIQVQNDQASVTIQAQNATVRDLLEQNSGRLREMLDEQGLDLSQFDVSDQGSGDQRQSSPFADAATASGDKASGDKASGEVSNGETVTTGEMHLNWSEGVDLYA